MSDETSQPGVPADGNSSVQELATGVRSGTRTMVQSVERAAAILSFLLSTRGSMSIQEIAQGTGLHRTVTHRLTRTLEHLDMVASAGSGRYRIGPAMLLYGNHYVDSLLVRRIALPYLLDFRERVVAGRPWVVSLAVPVQRDTVTVERFWHPDAPLDSILMLGTRLPMTRSASGRAILSTFPTPAVVNLIGPESAEQLEPVLTTAKGQGNVALVQGEFAPGVSAASAAIRGPDGEGMAAVTVSGTDPDGEMEDDQTFLPALRRVAGAISAAAGGSPMTRPER